MLSLPDSHPRLGARPAGDRGDDRGQGAIDLTIQETATIKGPGPRFSWNTAGEDRGTCRVNDTLTFSAADYMYRLVSHNIRTGLTFHQAQGRGETGPPGSNTPKAVAPEAVCLVTCAGLVSRRSPPRTLLPFDAQWDMGPKGGALRGGRSAPWSGICSIRPGAQIGSQKYPSYIAI